MRSKLSNDLVYDYETLRARNEIRDHYSNLFIKDIYENSGQLLSLIRVKLALAKDDPSIDSRKELAVSGDMLGVVIKNLKQISRFLFPEKAILSESGFIDALREELKVDETDNPGKRFKVTGIPCVLAPGTGLILFQVIIQITSRILKENGENGLSLEINYTRRRMRICIRFNVNISSFNYPGNEDNPVYADPLTIEERIKLIDASLKLKKMKNGQEEVQLILDI